LGGLRLALGVSFLGVKGFGGIFSVRFRASCSSAEVLDMWNPYSVKPRFEDARTREVGASEHMTRLGMMKPYAHSKRAFIRFTARATSYGFPTKASTKFGEGQSGE